MSDRQTTTRQAGGTHLTPLRVLMVAATPYFADRGCHVRIQGQALALQRRGVEVFIATYGIGRDVAGGRIERARSLPGYRRLDAAPTLGKLALDLLLLLQTIAVARRVRPHVIHAHTQEGGAVGLLVGLVAKAPVVLDLQSRRVAEELATYGKSRPGGALYRIADWFDRLLPARADAVVASTETIAEFVLNEAPPRGPVAVLGDAIDATELPPAEPELARSLGLDPNCPIIVYLGLLTESQGVDSLLRAMAVVRRERPRVQLLVMGYPDVERWRQYAYDLGLGQDTVFTGRMPFDQAPRHLALGTVAVSAKRDRTEGNGKLLLYMACGLATVALDTTINRKILGDDGVFVTDDSPESLAQAIVRLLDDQSERQRRGRALRARVAAEASWDARAAQLETLYRALPSHWERR